jgi:hypothetical protein
LEESLASSPDSAPAAGYFLNLAMDFLTVAKLVRVPPSQRSTAVGHGGGVGGLADDLAGPARLVPTKSTLPPEATVVLDEGVGLLEELVSLAEVDDA